jgi:hypothetical protein
VARPDERENYFPFPDRLRAENNSVFLLVPSFLFRISETLPFGSLALGKIEAAEMLAFFMQTSLANPSQGALWLVYSSTIPLDSLQGTTYAEHPRPINFFIKSLKGDEVLLC